MAQDKVQLTWRVFLFLLGALLLGIIIGWRWRPDPKPLPPPPKELVQLEQQVKDLRARLHADSLRNADSVATLAKARAKEQRATAVAMANADTLRRLRLAGEAELPPNATVVPVGLYNTAVAEGMQLREANTHLAASLATADANAALWKGQLAETQALLELERKRADGWHEEYEKTAKKYNELAANQPGWRIPILGLTFVVGPAAVVTVDGVEPIAFGGMIALN